MHGVCLSYDQPRCLSLSPSLLSITSCARLAQRREERVERKRDGALTRGKSRKRAERTAIRVLTLQRSRQCNACLHATPVVVVVVVLVVGVCCLLLFPSLVSRLSCFLAAVAVALSPSLFSLCLLPLPASLFRSFSLSPSSSFLASNHVPPAASLSHPHLICSTVIPDK